MLLKQLLTYVLSFDECPSVKKKDTFKGDTSHLDNNIADNDEHPHRQVAILWLKLRTSSRLSPVAWSVGAWLAGIAEVKAPASQGSATHRTIALIARQTRATKCIEAPLTAAGSLSL